jgi:hypothetical protein
VLRRFGDRHRSLVAPPPGTRSRRPRAGPSRA